MIVTKKHLTEIENLVGHSCKAGVLAGFNQGSIAIRVWADKPYGEKFTCELVLEGKDYLEDKWKPKLERFKYFAKGQFDDAFAS